MLSKYTATIFATAIPLNEFEVDVLFVIVNFKISLDKISSWRMNRIANRKN